jgi:hypothetical protein
VTTDDGGSDNQIGGPPPVLLAALGAAVLIAVGLVAAFASLRGDDPAEPAAERPAAAKTVTTDDRVLLLVYVGGSGIGRVQIGPSDQSCNAACEYKFTEDTRVTATVEPASGSTFEGWGEICSGKQRCSFVMDRPRTLSATFETPAVDALCDAVDPADRDPTCPPVEPGTTTEPVVPGPDCEDARDNDNDGLTDTAQDPDCETTGSESGTTAPPDGTSPPSATPPPPAAIAPNECADGEDNDGDGLTDRAQDPDCEKGRSESG